jgi:hypothetical protein
MLALHGEISLCRILRRRKPAVSQRIRPLQYVPTEFMYVACMGRTAPTPCQGIVSVGSTTDQSIRESRGALDKRSEVAVGASCARGRETEAGDRFTHGGGS